MVQEENISEVKPKYIIYDKWDETPVGSYCGQRLESVPGSIDKRFDYEKGSYTIKILIHLQKIRPIGEIDMNQKVTIVEPKFIEFYQEIVLDAYNNKFLLWKRIQ